jgi:hypothetical protein
VLLGKQSTGLMQQTLVIQDSRTCGPGLFSEDMGIRSPADCLVCPAGSLCPGGSNISQCGPGTFGASTGLRSQGQCSACPRGSYCTGGASVLPCPKGSYSIATGLDQASACGRCLAGFYCPNATVIVACPSNTNSPAGSSDLVSCTCNAGYKCTVTKVVHAEVTLPVSAAAFAQLQTAYIAAVAAAAGVDISKLVIVSITPAAGGGRRLLSADAYVEIHTSIYGSRHAAKPHMALASLDEHLASRGLPAMVSSPRVSLHQEIQHSVKTQHESI